jgi:glutamine synthetase
MRFEELQEQNDQLWEHVHSQVIGNGVRAVGLFYTENSGITRVKSIPVERLRGAARSGIGMSPVFDAFLFDDSITSSRYSGGPMGELRLVPDLSCLIPLEASPGWAMVPVERFRQDLKPHPLCHRQYVRRSYQRLCERGISSKMAFEIEWAISLAREDEFIPTTQAPAYSLDRLGELDSYVMDIYNALTAQQISVEQIHPEYAPGQFEISIEASDPIRAADLRVVVRHTIKLVSKKHGYRVSFAPLVTAGGVGNGGHLHVSFKDEAGPIFARAEEERFALNPKARSLLAGLLMELPALCAVGASSPASYLRLVPHRWAGAFQCWGLDNREAALRLVAETNLVSKEGANVEIKPFDLSSSPYLATGSICAVAGSYVDSKLEVGEPISVDPGSLSESERESLGVNELPHSLSEAVDMLSKSDVLRDSMGEELLEAFVAVKYGEILLTKEMTPEEIVSATRWRY